MCFKAIFVSTITILFSLSAYGQGQINQSSVLNSITLELGSEKDFDKSGMALLTSSRAWGQTGRDGDILYRTIKPKATADILFYAIDVDAKGFCKHDMILEILYRDDISEELSGKYRGRDRVEVQSRIDFLQPDEYCTIGNFAGKGDGKWKTARIFIARTPFQLMRKIDGSFQFKFFTSSFDTKSLPISSIHLVSVETKEFIRLREQDRVQRGLKRVEYSSAGNNNRARRQWKDRDFVVYPVNCLQLIFPNSGVNDNLVNKPLRCFEIPGHSEAVSFVFHPFVDFQKIRFELGDLVSNSGIIESKNLSLNKVVFNDQRWGWGVEKKYGSCPDYLMPIKECTNIKTGINQQFWLKINVPNNVKADLYEGDITLVYGEKERHNIKLFLEVLPVKLLTNRVMHLVYHSPYFRIYHKDAQKIMKDMKRHGLMPIMYPGGLSGEIINAEMAFIFDKFERELKIFKEVYPLSKSCFIGLFDFHHVWNKLKGPLPQFQYNFARFELAYGNVLKNYAAIAKKYDLEPVFSFMDEPNLNKQNRRVAYLCSKIAQENKFRTWCTFLPSADVQLPLSKQDKEQKINYFRPLSEVLDILVGGIWEIDKATVLKYQKSDTKLAYYTTFTATSIVPGYNRFLHGIYPFVIDSQYVFSYAYRDKAGDPFDDMDNTINGAVSGSSDYLLTYPSWQWDMLPTISYEALGEGVEDSHLISTLQALSEEAIRSNTADVRKLGKESSGYLDDILKRLSKDFKHRYWNRHNPIPVDPMEKTILRDLSSGKSEDYEIFNKIRREICDRIIVLQKLLGVPYETSFTKS